NQRVRRIAAGSAPGITGDADELITTVAGTGSCGFNGDGQAATLAFLCNPRQAIVLPGNDLLIADSNTYRVRRVEAATGVIRTLVGTGPAGFSGDGGPAPGVRPTAP